MQKQEDIHDRSWETRKESDEQVRSKPRIQYTIDTVDRHLTGSERVFDLGCGSGVVGSEILAPNDSIVVDGCDISASALERASSRYRSVYQCNIDDTDIPVDSDSYDIVLCTDVLEHLLDPEHAFSEIERILVPGGSAFVSVPNFGYLRYRKDALLGRVPSILTDERHFQAYSIERIARLAKAAGLFVDSVSGVGRLQRMAEFRPHLFAKTLLVELQSSE